MLLKKTETKPLVRIFSYLPSPRIWKPVITSRLLDINIEILGTRPEEISNWLWDYKARKLSSKDIKKYSDYKILGKKGFSTKIHKTPEFLKAHPFGVVPAAFAKNGKVGIFESNSIMRLIARLKKKHLLYGANVYERSRIDSFLDASLVFATFSQRYLLSIMNNNINSSIKIDANDSFVSYFSGLETSLKLNKNKYIVGSHLTLADICFFCEYSLFSREQLKPKNLKGLWKPIVNDNKRKLFPRAFDLYYRLYEKKLFKEISSEYLNKIIC